MNPTEPTEEQKLETFLKVVTRPHAYFAANPGPDPRPDCPKCGGWGMARTITRDGRRHALWRFERFSPDEKGFSCPECWAEQIHQAQETALAFDKERHCGWNWSKRMCRYDNAPEFCATDFMAFASMGYQCHATIHELALLNTLRPCKKCGSDHLYASNYQISCCSCFGDGEVCENREETLANGDDPGTTCCCQCAENMNLPDAITLWNLRYADDGPPGRVIVIH